MRKVDKAFFNKERIKAVMKEKPDACDETYLTSIEPHVLEQIVKESIPHATLAVIKKAAIKKRIQTVGSLMHKKQRGVNMGGDYMMQTKTSIVAALLELHRNLLATKTAMERRFKLGHSGSRRAAFRALHDYQFKDKDALRVARSLQGPATTVPTKERTRTVCATAAMADAAMVTLDNYQKRRRATLEITSDGFQEMRIFLSNGLVKSWRRSDSMSDQPGLRLDTINDEQYSETLLLVSILRKKHATYHFVRDDTLEGIDIHSLAEEAVCAGDHAEMLSRIQVLADNNFDYCEDGDTDEYRKKLHANKGYAYFRRRSDSDSIPSRHVLISEHQYMVLSWAKEPGGALAYILNERSANAPEDPKIQRDLVTLSKFTPGGVAFDGERVRDATTSKPQTIRRISRRIDVAELRAADQRKAGIDISRARYKVSCQLHQDNREELLHFLGVEEAKCMAVASFIIPRAERESLRTRGRDEDELHRRKQNNLQEAIMFERESLAAPVEPEDATTVADPSDSVAAGTKAMALQLERRFVCVESTMVNRFR